MGMTWWRGDETSWTLIPAYMRGPLERYVMHGIHPGGFLTAVLSNDLKGAFGRADRENLICLKAWVQFMAWEVPAASQGSEVAVENWIALGGLNGIERKREEQDG